VGVNEEGDESKHMQGGARGRDQSVAVYTGVGGGGAGHTCSDHALDLRHGADGFDSMSEVENFLGLWTASVIVRTRATIPSRPSPAARISTCMRAAASATTCTRGTGWLLLSGDAATSCRGMRGVEEIDMLERWDATRESVD